MDRSFLSDANVVAASRNFVCIRLLTYEDQAEADFMKSIYTGKSGQLENTTFAILSPDGKKPLTAVGRAPFHEYRGSRDMASGMNKIAENYQGASEAVFTDPNLPLTSTLDLALNVAASDNLPLIVLVGDDQESIDRLSENLLPLVWSESIAGQFAYTTVLEETELEPITGLEPANNEGKNKQSGRILIVEPGQFGVSGRVLKQFNAMKQSDEMRAELLKVVADFPHQRKDHGSHVQAGIKLGIDWKSKIAETDQESLRARKRARGE